MAQSAYLLLFYSLYDVYTQLHNFKKLCKRKLSFRQNNEKTRKKRNKRKNVREKNYFDFLGRLPFCYFQRRRRRRLARHKTYYFSTPDVTIITHQCYRYGRRVKTVTNIIM